MTVRNGGNLLSVGGQPLLASPFARPLRIPSGTLLRGVNTTSYNTTVRQQWGSAWSWAFMKRQIDNALAVEANALRFTAAVYGVQTGDVSLADLLTRSQQVLDYCAGHGLYVYPCAGGAPSSFLADPSAVAAFQVNLAPWVRLCSDYASVIGFDALNEPYAQYGATVPPDQIAALVGQIIDTYRENSPLAVTADRVVFHSAYQWRGDAGYFLDRHIDFVDVHVYDDKGAAAMAATDPQRLTASKEGRKPIIIGEFGVNATSSDRAAYYAAIKDQVTSNPQIVGAFAWAAIDTTDDPAGQWGLFSGPDNTERTDITNVFRTFPTSR